MNCSLDLPSQLARNYSSSSQKARVATEAWVQRRIACPSCGGSLKDLPANTPVRDFACHGCDEEYQLKAKNGAIGRRLTGAAYGPTLASFRDGSYPSLIVLSYDRGSWSVRSVDVVYRGALTESCLVPRKPLGPKAKRAGWQGCTIALDSLPTLARVAVLRNGVWSDQATARAGWQVAARTFAGPHETRGWTADVLRVIDPLPQRFTLADVYAAEATLTARHPANRNVQAKIRQQLQVLRDRGAVRFVAPGEYERLPIGSAARQGDEAN